MKKNLIIVIASLLIKSTLQFNMYFIYNKKKIYMVENSKISNPFKTYPEGKKTLEANFIHIQAFRGNTTLFFETTATYMANLTLFNAHPLIDDTSYTLKIPSGNSSIQVNFTCEGNFKKPFKEIRFNLNLNPFEFGASGGVNYYMRFFKICDNLKIDAFDNSYIVLGIMMLVFVYLQSKNISGETLNRHYMDNLNPFFLAIYFGSGSIAIFLGFCYTSIIQGVLIFCFAITGFCSICIMFSKLLKYMYTNRDMGRERNIGIFSMNDILCWIISFTLIIGWVYFDDWLSHNIIALCILGVLLDIVHFPSFKQLLLISCLLIAFDLIWIIRTLPEYNYIPMSILENFRRLPCYLKIPRLEEFPGPEYIIFGFTDVLILGITLKFFRAFDEYKERYGYKSSYGLVCFLNFGVSFMFFGGVLKMGISTWPFSSFFIALTMIFLLSYAGCNEDCMNLMTFPDIFVPPPIPLENESSLSSGEIEEDMDRSIIIAELLNNDSEGFLEGIGNH